MSDIVEIPTISYGFARMIFAFLVDLRIRFPKRRDENKENYWLLVVKNPSFPINNFRKFVAGCEEQKNNADESVFSTYSLENRQIIKNQLHTCDILKICNLHLFWNEELDDNTKLRIWEHLKHMTFIVNSIDKNREKLHLLVPVCHEIVEKSQKIDESIHPGEILELLTDCNYDKDQEELLYWLFKSCIFYKQWTKITA